jgi:hypothetical protein
MEIWKDIPNYEGKYQVSNLGNVKSLISNKVLVLCTVSGGYKSVSLGRNKSKSIHRLVALAFIGNPPTGASLVLHGDGNRANNALPNLRYGSFKDNAEDAKKHGTQVKGSRQHAAKLNIDQVREILTSKSNGAELAKRFGVTSAAISSIRCRKNWAHV